MVEIIVANQLVLNGTEYGAGDSVKVEPGVARELLLIGKARPATPKTDITKNVKGKTNG